MNFVCATDLSQLSAATLLYDFDGGFVVLKDLEVNRPLEVLAAKLKGRQGLREEAVREADHLGFRGVTVDCCLFLAYPACKR